MDPVSPLYLLLLATVAAAAILIVHRRSVRNAEASESDEVLAHDLFLRNAFDRASLGVAFMNGEGQWLEANRRFLNALGYAKGELGNVPLRLMTHPEDRKREASLFAELRAGKRSGYTITKRLQRKSGEFRTFRVQMLRCVETPQAIYQCSIDDGEQQATRLELISTALGDLDRAAVIFCDASGVVSAWNHGAERLFGYAETEIVGKPWGLLHRDQNPASVAKLLTSAAQHGFTRTLTARVHQDGSNLAVRSVLIPDLRGRDSAGFLEVCYAEGALEETAPRPAAEHESQHLHNLREDNAHLREELERHLASVRQLAEIHTQNESLRQSLERKNATESQLREAVTTLRVANGELTRKVRILSGAVRKMVSARKSSDASPTGAGIVAGPSTPPAELSWNTFHGTAINETVRQIAREEQSGILQLRSGTAEKRLVFESGRLVAITSDNDARLLGQLLVDAGMIDEEQRGLALESHRATGIPFGSSIVRMGLATEDDIAEIIRAKARRELEDAGTWSEGEYAFEVRESSADVVPIAVDILAVLAELAPELSTDLPASDEEIEAVTSAAPPSPIVIPAELIAKAPEPEPHVETAIPLVPTPIEAAEEVDPEAAAPAEGGNGRDTAAPEDEPSPGRFIGRASGKGRTYHVIGCKSAKTIPKKQRVYFDSASQAAEHDFKACARCLPDQ